MLLLSNDDGVHATGLRCLASELGKHFDILVSAPDRDHSGASSSLTLSRPLRVTEIKDGTFSVDGTPADSVHLGITSICARENFEPDRVIAGINSHENLGDDVLYSGTVAAAIEGRFLDQAPIAVSLVNQGNGHYDTAAKVIVDLLNDLPILSLPKRTILNVNVPDVPYEHLKGTLVTRLGHRTKGLPPERTLDPRGKERYWIAQAGEGDDAGEGTDFWAVANGYVSISPVKVDMTQYDSLETMKNWLSE